MWENIKIKMNIIGTPTQHQSNCLQKYNKFNCIPLVEQTGSPKGSSATSIEYRNLK